MSEEYEGYTVVVIPKEKQKPKLKKPRRYKVIILNDDYTPMEFVIYVLQTIFKKNYDEAKKVMLLVHNEGKGICGVYSLDIAETKANQVVEFSRINQHPLECKVEKQ
jgi:ATP-dependent Clp protease adaptor protein ClpS